MRIGHILCPVDFSDFSRHAFDRAVAVARGYEASIAVLHVLPAPSTVPVIPFGPEGPGPFGLHPADRDVMAAEVRRFLAIDHDLDIKIDYHVAQAAAPHKEILTQADRVNADLIVVGTHGRSGFSRLMLGSVAEKVLRASAVPVLTVPPHVPDALSIGRSPFDRILLATDFSAGSEPALAYAASLALTAAARLTIVNVVEPLPVGGNPMVGTSFDVCGYQAAMERDAKGRLHTVAMEASGLGCNTGEVLVTGKPYVEILRVAAEEKSDVIVLGVQGRNALDRLVFGATAEHVVRRATCPVLTIRTGDRCQ